MVALIVTIVVLLILVSITINTVVGDNGIITQAQQKEKELNQTQLNTELTRNELAAELEENKTGKGDGIVGFHPDGGNYVLPTGSNVAKVISEIQLANINSGFDIIEYAWSSSNTLVPAEETSWIKAELVSNAQTITNTQATQGNNYLWVKITDATEGSTKTFVSSNFNVMNQGDVANKITVTPNKTSWTKDDVTVTINYGDNLPDNRKVGIGSANTDVEGNSTTITMTSNGTIYAEATDIAGNKVTINLEISNIDKTGPTVSLTRNSATTNSIKVTATATDAGSGVDTYTFYYKKSSESTYKQAQTGTSNTCTFTGLTQTTNYDIKVVVTDKVGNSTEKTLTSQATGTVPTASGNITFSSATWSSGKASVTMSTATSYTIQYQIGSTTGTWSTGTTASNISTGSTVYARLWDGTNAGSYASLLVKDTVAPGAPTVSVSAGTAGENGWYRSNVTVKITAGTDAQSGVNRVTYILTGAMTKAETTISSGGTISITAEGTTTITAYTYDNAGNKSAAKTLAVKKDTVAPTVSYSLSDYTMHQSFGACYYINFTASDGTSGVATYYYSTNNGSSYSSSTSARVRVGDMTSDFSHTLKLQVKDKAGNVTTLSHGTTIDTKYVFIQQQYIGWLGRMAADSEVTGWAAKKTNDAIYGIAASSEAINRTSTIDSFLIAMYRAFYGREPDSAGLTTWPEYYNKNGRSATIKIQYEKPEPEYTAVYSRFATLWNNR